MVGLVALSVGGWPLALGPLVVGGAVAGHRAPRGGLDGAVCGFGVGIVVGAVAFAWVIDVTFVGSLGAGDAPSGLFFGAIVLAMAGGGTRGTGRRPPRRQRRSRAAG